MEANRNPEPANEAGDAGTWCGYGESNPGLKLGKLASYH